MGALGALQTESASALLCSPVAAEIRFGLERMEPGSHRRRLLEAEYHRLRAAVAWEDWNESAALMYGRIKASLEARGLPVDDMDLIIASVALACGAALATRNARHFQRIEGLEIQDWSF